MSRGLTGGTGDVNPQWYKFSCTQSAADTTTTTAIPLPVPKLPSSKKPTVVEVLKVYWDNQVNVETDNFIQAILSTKNYGTTVPSITDGGIIDQIYQAIKITTSGQIISIAPVIHDLTDGAGHGMLVATDNIYLQVNSAATSQAIPVVCWILYRMKEITLAEYIGIVQSQQ